MKQITAYFIPHKKTYTWKLFAHEYILNWIKRDKRFRDIEVVYKEKPKEEKPYYWRRADLME